MNDLTKKVISSEQYEVKGAIEMSNKVVLKRFLKQYNEALNLVVTSENPNKLNLIQFNTLFEILKLISPPDSKEELMLKDNSSKIKDDLNLKGVSILTESTNKQHEKKLVCQIWENLQNDEGLVITDHIFLFLIAVLNIYEFYLYDSFKHLHKQEDEMKKVQQTHNKTGGILGKIAEETLNLNNNVPGNIPIGAVLKKSCKGEKDDRTAKEKEKEKIMMSIQLDINSKIKISKKYCSFDDTNSFLLSINNAKRINKDFNLLYVNWSTNNYLALQSINNEEAERHNNPDSYKPKINEKSAKIFTEFRKKLQNDTSGILIIK